MNFNNASNMASAAANQFNKTEGADKVDEAALGNDPNQIAAANKVVDLQHLMKGDKDKDESAEGMSGMIGKFTAPVQDAFKNVQSHLPGMGGGDKDEKDKKDSGFPGQAAVTNMFNSMGGGDNKGDDKKDSGFPGQAAVAGIFGGGDNKGENNNDSQGNFLSKVTDQANSLASNASDRLQGTANNVDDEVVNVSDFLTKPTFPPN